MNETEKKAVTEVAGDMAKLEIQLVSGNLNVGSKALAQMLDGFTDRLLVAAGKIPADDERLKRYHTVRYTGIEFQRYFSPHFVRLVGVFVNPAGDKNQNHVYELLVKESANRPGRWIAKGTNDGRELFTLTCASKWGAERYGFGALRSYLLRHLRRTIRANKAKESK